MQFHLATLMFNGLWCICYNNSKMRRRMWNLKEIFVLEERGACQEFGELHLVNEILKDEYLLLKDTNLEILTSKLISRLCPENNEILFEIFSRISSAEISEDLVNVILDSLSDRPTNKQLISYKEFSLPALGSLQQILINLLKSNKVSSLSKRLVTYFPYESMWDKLVELNQHYSVLFELFDLKRKEERVKTIEDSTFTDKVNNKDFTIRAYHKFLFPSATEIVAKANQHFETVFDLYLTLHWPKPVSVERLSAFWDKTYSKVLQSLANHIEKLEEEEDILKNLPLICSISKLCLRLQKLISSQVNTPDIPQNFKDTLEKIQGIQYWLSLLSTKINKVENSNEFTDKIADIEIISGKLPHRKSVKGINKDLLEYLFARIKEYLTEYNTIPEWKRQKDLFASEFKQYLEDHQGKVDNYYQLSTSNNEFRDAYSEELIKFMTSKLSKQRVNDMYKSIAANIFENLLREDYTAFKMLRFTYLCEKKRSNIFAIIFTYKVHTEVLKIAKRELEESESAQRVEQINTRIVDFYESDLNINSVFKLLWESTDCSYDYWDDVFGLLCYFLNGLLRLRRETLQEKMKVLFERRDYSQKFFKQMHRYLTCHTRRLNSGNFVHIYSSTPLSYANAWYFVDENREKQVLDLMSGLCSKLNYFMKDYFRSQAFSNESYDIVQATLEYYEALKPYIHFDTTADIFVSCMEAVFQIVDGYERSDDNTLKAVRSGIISTISNVLKLRYYLEDLSKLEDNHDTRALIVGHNLDLMTSHTNVESSMAVSRFFREFFSKDAESRAYNESFDSLKLVPRITDNKSKHNFLIATLKSKALETLLELTNTGEELTPFMYNMFYAELDPHALRVNVAYQRELFKYYHQEKYRVRLLNLGDLGTESITDSFFIIEIGYLVFMFLIKLRQYTNDKIPDPMYNSKLLAIMPLEERQDVEIEGMITTQMANLYMDIYKRTKRAIFSPKPVSYQKVIKNSQDDAKVEKDMKFYADTTSEIDIYFEDKIVTYIFPLLPYCRLSSNKQKEEFMHQIDRSSAQAKCSSLFEESKYLIKQMKIHYWMQNNNTEIGKVLIKYTSLWISLFKIYIIALNLIMLASYSESNGSREEDPMLFGLSVTGTKVIMFILGLLCGITWLLSSIPSLVTLFWMAYYRAEIEDDLAKKDTSDPRLLSVSHSRKRKLISTNYKILTSPMLYYTLLLGVSIVLGLALHPFFYAFLVTYLIVESPQMNSLLRAIWEPRLAIIATIVLMFLIVYVLVVVSYQLLYSYYPENSWVSLWSCFLVSVDQTLKNGGIGNFLDSAYAEVDDGIEIKYERVLFDNIEFLLITLLLIAIISGIIIDKFGELRQRREDNILDATSSCFICGKERKEFDRDLKGPSFEQHVKFEHNLWDYIYFIAYVNYLNEHNPDKLRAVEKYVADKMAINDCTWFPCFSNE